MVSFVYHVSNTTSIEVSKIKNNFVVKENVLQLNKNVVIKNAIKNNLYSSATDVGVEPNIIVEFAKFWV